MIKDLEVGKISSFPALVRKIEIKQKKNGESYADFTLSDKTGSVKGKAWRLSQVKDVEEGNVVWVDSAGVQEYAGEMQVVLNGTLECVVDADPLEYCVSSKFAAEDMLAVLQKCISEVENEWCKKLLLYFFDDKSFLDMFCTCAAGETVHGAYVGGLLEHTLFVTRAVKQIGKIYTWLNKDLMITAAILHDIGKTKELSPFPKNQYTDYGRFVGHVVGSAFMVNKACDEISGFPDDVRLKLIHCILAHHGKLEFGSPKLPVVPEAFVISTMDNLDAKLNIFNETVKVNEWSSYNRFLEGYVTSGDFNEEKVVRNM